VTKRQLATIDKEYELYRRRMAFKHCGERERPEGQSFAEAMCSDSTVEGLENGEEIDRKSVV
jgi:hypothetical protein